MQPHFSPGADERQLATEVNALLECKWTMDEDNMGVQKTFNFPTYAKALVTHSLG
jgi:pterin-4a-carbinolamine dehydratase